MKSELLGIARDEDAAREALEKLRWPNGAVCPKCGGADPYKLTPKATSKRPGRKGLYKCRSCRKQFTVTVGTIFEDSHIPLATWLSAIYLICASKKGISAHQLHRMLGVTYKSAWFMAHRVRWAMTQEPLSGKLAGIVEADETYVGGGREATYRHGRGKNLVPVFTLVERGGRARSFVPERVTSANLGRVINRNVLKSAEIMTDEGKWYREATYGYKRQTINHSKGEYARGVVNTNTVEGFFSLLKRGIVGTFHHVSVKHLHRYLAEFDFRYNHRDVTDRERTAAAVRASEGKRLRFRSGS